ncbi:hypothetical protein Tco_0387405 [Tanacetum coccineum]
MNEWYVVKGAWLEGLINLRVDLCHQQVVPLLERKEVEVEFGCHLNVRARILELKRRYFEDYYSEDQYAVSIKEDTAYPCLHSPKTTEDKAQYAVSRETQYAVFNIWNEYNILKDIKRGPYSKKSSIPQQQNAKEGYGLREIPKFCDATLKKVLKEVSAAHHKLKDPPLVDLDKDIIELFETGIMKHLKCILREYSDLGSILEETGQDCNFTQRRLEELLTEGGDGVRIPCDAVWNCKRRHLPPSPLVIDNTRKPQTSDIIALLNDLSYISPNNEQNEPTQEDIGETSNEPTQAKHNEFEELYVSANEELYPSCDYVTRLDFMAKFTYFKVKGKLTDSIFNEMLEFFQHVFPTMKGYKLPPSYYAIKKTFKTIGLGYESIHACVNDCFLFRGDNNKDVHFCPVCKTSRWKDSNTPGKKVPKKVLRYFSIIPRLQRLYKSSHTAKEMTWHATGKCTEPGKMQHPVDGRAWKNFDTKYPNFAKEPRNVRLGLAADGFNPFGNLSQAYNMWPVILTTYNLPSWLCMKESSFMLTLLIPGPKSPGKDIDVYLRPLIDDLKVLWALKGVETIDVATG